MNKSESKYFNTAEAMDRAFLELLDEKDFAYITVKEICQRAGVNRSTFYLHYETIADLLSESVAYKNRQMMAYFASEQLMDIAAIEAASTEDLYFITPQYLRPFLQYVKDHSKLFQTVLEHADLLGSQNLMFPQVFYPIMGKFHVPEEKKPFLIMFTLDGIMGIVKLWLKNGCREEIDFVAEMIMECIARPEYSTEENTGKGIEK